MPGIKLENINEGVCWGLWKIEENADYLTQEATLTPEEEEELHKISNIKRKKEWLAARVMLKTIVNQCGHDYKGLRKDKYNKPHLYEVPYQISLAHCFPFATALVNKKFSCGIDIEKPKPALFHVSRKFLNESEQSYIPREPDTLCLVWAAKEVLYKIHGRRYLSFQKHMQICPFTLEQSGNLKAKIKISDFEQEFQLQFLFLDDHLICYSV